MVKVDDITKDWKEAGSFPAQINLYGFWDEHCFLTKSGDLGNVLRVGGIDYESLDHAGRDYAVKRLEAAFRSLDDKSRLYQILFKRNRPAIPHAEYVNPLVRAAVEQRSAFLESKADRLYSIEIFWVVMIDGSYQKTGLMHALAQLPKQPRSSLRALRSLFSGSKARTLLYEQIERDRLRLQQKVQSLSGQLNDLMTVELPGAEETLRILHRLVTRAANAVEQFRSDYPVKALVFDYTFRDKKPFDVSAIYHDDKFTYIRSTASEKFSIYELKDKKPDLITFQLQDGTYILPTVVDKGYLQIGKNKLNFQRKAR